LVAAFLLALSGIAAPSASAAGRVHLMVWVNEAGVWTVPGYRPYAKLIKTTHFGDCIWTTPSYTLSYEGHPWVEVETANSRSGRLCVRLDLLAGSSACAQYVQSATTRPGRLRGHACSCRAGDSRNVARCVELGYWERSGQRADETVRVRLIATQRREQLLRF